MVTCATTALAMVFSVQQGEHGPLVVYKLKVPGDSAAVATPAPAAPVTVTPTRAPKVLGTVAMPPAAPAPSGVSVLDILEQIAPPAATPTAAAPATAPSEASLDWGSQDGITLDRVNSDITWRRETAERLPDQPFAPRF